MAHDTQPLTELDDAIAQILAQARTVTATETVALGEATSRVLAADVVSPLNVPAFDNSAMDGYALRSADVCEADVGVKRFIVSQRVPAGAMGRALEFGTLARIFTGAPVPAGADAVVMQENTAIQADGSVVLNVRPEAGDNIRRVGEDIRLGAVVVPACKRLGPADVGVAASVGQAELKVFRRPKVALFVTGDELVEPGGTLSPGNIYDSNRYVLGDLLRRMGCEVHDMGVLRDELSIVKKALEEASGQYDLVLTSGGVSVGEEDHVKQAVTELGELTLWRLAIKPGKPLAFGRIGKNGGQTFFIGLPGNPVSSFVTFLLVGRPFVQKLSGEKSQLPRTLTLTAAFSAKTKGRREFLRARVCDDGRVEVYPTQSSGVLTSMAWAQGLVDLPAHTHVQPGDMVRYIPLTELLA